MNTDISIIFIFFYFISRMIYCCKPFICHYYYDYFFTFQYLLALGGEPVMALFHRRECSILIIPTYKSLSPS